MATPEVPLCYVGVAKKSAAFRLMKQMVSLISSGKYKSKNPVDVKVCLMTLIMIDSEICLIDGLYLYFAGMGRRRRSWQG